MNSSLSQIYRRSSAVLTAVVVLTALAAMGCSRRPYKIVPMGHASFNAAPRPAERDLPMYAGEAPLDGLEFATLISRRSKEKTEESVCVQYDDIREAALSVNADAVVNLALKPIRRTGWIGDPNTPFPSWKHGEWMEYELHGVAVVFPDKERELRAAVAEDAPLPVDDAGDAEETE